MSEVFEFERPDGSILEVEAPSRDAAIKAYQRMRSQPEETPSGFMPFVNRGISQNLGGIMDASNAVAGLVGLGSKRPFLGSERIEGGMRDVLGEGSVPREGEQAETITARMGETLGMGAASLLPIGVLGRMTGAGMPAGAAVPQGAAATTGRMVSQPFFGTPRAPLSMPQLSAPAGSGALRRAGTAVANAGGRGATAAANVARRPGTSTLAATGTELAASAAAGGLGMIGERSAPFGSEDLGRGLGELAGAFTVGGGLGFLGSGGMTGYLSRKFSGPVQRTVAPFTKSGSEEVAGARLQELAADPQAADRAIAEGGPGDLTPAQRTGDIRLMALEKEVIERDPAMWEAFQERAGAAERELVEQLRGISDGDPRATADFVTQRRREFRERLDNQVQQAVEDARAKAAQLEPRRSETANAGIIREELDKAFANARAQERVLWDAVPQDAVVPLSTARETFRNIDAQTGMARKGNIPEVAKMFLGADSPLGESNTVQEVHALYSALRQTAREARAGTAPNNHKAALADRLATALLDDMGASARPTTEVGALINTARNYSADMHSKFTQGEVGRVLGQARSGGDTIDPQRLLESTLRRGGAAGTTASREFGEALGYNVPARQAEADYLKRQFTDAAMREGGMNVNAARTFLKNNRELLDEFPTLRDQMREAVRANDDAAAFAKRTESRVKAADSRRSATATMEGARYGDEMAAVFSARNPVQAARTLRNTAAKDGSGDALAGLKRGAVDHVLNMAKGRGVDQSGEALFSGRAILGALENPKTRGALRQILEPAEIDRMKRLATELSKLETSRGDLPNVGGTLMEKPNTALSYLVRVFAARQGAQLGQGTSGASLQAAGMASKRAQRLMDNLQIGRAERLLADAMQDPELFRALLTRMDTPKAAQKVDRELTAWFGSLAVDSEQEE